MKKIITFISMYISLTATAGLPTMPITVTQSEKTIMSCEQGEGEQWYRVGIRINQDKSADALIVLNNEDNGSKILVHTIPILISKDNSGNFTFINREFYFKMLVQKNRTSDLIGQFTLSEYGPNETIQQVNLDCFLNDEIKYDIIIDLEPRISSGN